ncbi:hypothetical protein CMI38_00175 [Candidatus Pacearchaeota archaeon]|nr:hypothetical protein [Candidatus Pacearchaeota archaeon]
MINIFQSLGITGLILIILGVLIKRKNRKARDLVYILGGVLLAYYSFYIGDNIFLTLQVVFVLVSICDLFKLTSKK